MPQDYHYFSVTLEVRLSQRVTIMLSICITTWNTPVLLRKCIASVRRTLNNEQYEILVLDLGHDKTLKPASDLRIWRYSPPSPFAVSYNFLARHAKGEKILLLNSDAVLKKKCVESMLTELHDNVGAVGCQLVYPARSPWAGLVQHAGIFVRGIPPDPGSAIITRGFQQSNVLSLQVVEDVPAVTAACLLVQASAFNDVGGFDEKFINGYEDIALCLSLWAAGWRVRYCGIACATHLGNGTKGTTGNTATALEFAEQNARVLRKQLKRWRVTLEELQQFIP